MIVFILHFLLRISSVNSEIHSLKYFSTTSSGGSNFPEFVDVGFVDDVQITHYDSNTRRLVPKQDWMKKITENDPTYWDRKTKKLMGEEQLEKRYFETVKQRLNQTGGLHIFQKISGCEWNDETDEVKGFEQYGYDGEDFMFLDLKTKTWITPRPQAVIPTHSWGNDKALMEALYYYYTRECPAWLKTFFNYGRSSLMRKEPPSVFLLQKTPSSPVTCHATGFYPDRADLFWRKDEEELHEDLLRGEILPNHDGTFQMSVGLDLSLVEGEDWSRYSCVFHLDGVKEDILTPLNKRVIMTNRNRENPTTAVVVVVGVVLVVGVGLLLLTTFCIKRLKYKRKLDGYTPTNKSESSFLSGDQEMKKVTSEKQQLPETIVCRRSGSIPVAAAPFQFF